MSSVVSLVTQYASTTPTELTGESLEFAKARLAKSGLTPELMRVVPASSQFSDVCFGILYPHVSPPFVVVRADVEDRNNRYRGPAGRTAIYWADPGPEALRTFATAPVVAIIEGELKARAFFLATGIPTAGIRGCTGWSERITAHNSDIAPHRALLAGLLAGLGTGRTVVLGLDGDYENNPDVSRELAQLHMACVEVGSTVVALDFGYDALGNRQGADDFLVSLYGPDLFLRPTVTQDQVCQDILQPKYHIDVSQLIASEAWCMQNLERYNNELVDFTDRGNASLAVKVLGHGNLLYRTDLEQWVAYNKATKRWEILQSDTPTEVLNEVSHYRAKFADKLEAQFSAARLQGRVVKPEDEEAHLAKVKAWRASAAKLSGFRSRATILSELRGREGVNVSASHFAQDPTILAVANGVIDLDTGTLREETQKDMVLVRAPAMYLTELPDSEVARRTRKFISSVFAKPDGTPNPEKERYVQTRLGASLRGRCELGALEIWHSPPGCGKGVFFELVSKTLGPGYAKTVNVNTILTSEAAKGTSANSFLISIAGCRIVVLQEAARGLRWDHAMFKTLTGVVDTISTREMYGKAINFIPQFTMALLCNDIPDMAQSDAAMLQRIAITPLEHAHRRINQTAYAEGDDQLPAEDLWCRDVMAGEADAQAVMLAWLLEGSVNYAKYGVGETPSDFTQAKQTYADKQDVVKNWILERYEVTNNPADGEPVKMVHGIYYNSARAGDTETRSQPLPRGEFVSEVLKAFPSLTYGRFGRGAMHFIGLKGIPENQTK